MQAHGCHLQQQHHLLLSAAAAAAAAPAPAAGPTGGCRLLLLGRLVHQPLPVHLLRYPTLLH
jgi:hypothetical protein